MNADPSSMHCEGAQHELRPCAYCRTLFPPRRQWEAFCSAKCRNDYNTDIGTEGVVASVRKIARGASLVIHLSGPAAERALRLGLRDVVKVVKSP